MQERHYKTVLYFITAMIAVTLGMQVYWNYKNFEAGKQQLMNEVQISLDNAVDSYYASLAEKNLIGFTLRGDSLDHFEKQMEGMLLQIDKKGNRIEKLTAEGSTNGETISIYSGAETTGMDTLLKKIQVDKSTRAEAIQMLIKHDTVNHDNALVKLTSKVIWAITEDSLNLSTLDTLIKGELERKNISIDYGILFTDQNGSQQYPNDYVSTAGSFNTESKSSYLPKQSDLKLYFTNETRTILAKNLFGILASVLFAGAIIGCLLYLLKIIRHQKQLAEVKNDLISNITHEFKTPIATIGAAMEGIQVFNTENDVDKNMRYAKISSEQVEKLNGMVEKLLETATLDSETLKLDFEEVNLVDLLRKSATKEAFASENKTLSFESSNDIINASVDIFHFENAINNIIDNAIKYGGNKIEVAIKKSENSIEISISDNGTSLSEAHKKQIFEKFYRVPKGNTHDVKGFGIGLYYSKKIIEKHFGSISVDTHTQTTFKIVLPNA